jgi:hypothetical protein
MATYDEILEKGVYFVLPTDSDPPSLFAHLTICLVEGLQALGVPTFANRNYWLTNLEPQTYLLNYDSQVSLNDCAICAFDISAQCPEAIAHILVQGDTCNGLKVILDMSDVEFWHPKFNEFHAVFRTHLTSNTLIRYGDNYIPWAFGLSHRMQTATETTLDFSERKNQALVNFRPSLNQSVRVALEFAFIPLLEKLCTIERTVDSGEQQLDADQLDSLQCLNHLQLRSRHNPLYYHRLKDSKFCCSYGGCFNYTPHGVGIHRWDSWRFWESMAAGCVTFHLDLEMYKMWLPIMPENWKHYIGLNLANLPETVERLHDEPEILAQISIEGKQWALEHYTPMATASYFLDILMGEELGTTRSVLQFWNEVNVCA